MPFPESLRIIYAMRLFALILAAAIPCLNTPASAQMRQGAGCIDALPQGGVYLRQEKSGRGHIPAIYRLNENGHIYDAFVSDPVERAGLRGAARTTIVYTVWISNPLRGCLWTYQVAERPRLAPAQKIDQWPPSPPLLELTLKPVY